MKQVTNLFAIVFGMLLFLCAGSLISFTTNIVKYVMFKQYCDIFIIKIGVGLVSFAVIASIIYLLFEVYKGRFKITNPTFLVSILLIALLLNSTWFSSIYYKVPMEVTHNVNGVITIFRFALLFIMAFISLLFLAKTPKDNTDYIMGENITALLSIVFGMFLSANINIVIATISRLINAALYWVTVSDFVPIIVVLWLKLVIYGGLIYIAITLFKKKKNITINIIGILANIVLYLLFYIGITPLISKVYTLISMNGKTDMFYASLSRLEIVNGISNVGFYIILTIIACVYLRKANREEFM